MKYEERNDRSILVVEPDDDRVTVLSWLGQWQSTRAKQIIVVVPQDAVFRRPGDLREMQQVFAGQRVQGDMLVLIIGGNERLRLWARRQGFTVYATLETCLKTAWSGMPQGGIQSGSEMEPDLQVAVERLPQQPFYGHGARPGHNDLDSDTPGETYRSSVALVASRTTSGSQQPERDEDQRVRSAFWYASSTHATEPLVDQDLYPTSVSSIPFYPAISAQSSAATSVIAAEPVQMWSDWSAERGLGVATITPQAPISADTTFTLDVPYASPVWGEEIIALPSAHVQATQLEALRPPQVSSGQMVGVSSRGSSQELAVTKDNSVVYTRPTQVEPWWGIVLLHLHHIYRDRLLLVLVALVAFGILGGLSCGYLLTMIPVR